MLLQWTAAKAVQNCIPGVVQGHLEATSDDATAVRALSATDAEANRSIEDRLRMLTVVQVTVGS